MSIQYETRQRRRGSPTSILFRLQQSFTSLFATHYSQWLCRRRVRKSSKILESLPEHILHDIGWPSANDCLAKSERINQKKQ